MKTRTVYAEDGRPIIEYTPETEEDYKKLEELIKSGEVDSGTDQ